MTFQEAVARRKATVGRHQVQNSEDGIETKD